MAWQAYIDQQLVGKGHTEAACILSKADGTVWAKSPEFCPRGYPTEMAQDDGTSKTVQITEQADMVAVGKGQKPSTGLRINGVKYFVLGGGRPDTSAGYAFWKAKGPGAGLAIAVTKQCILVARCNLAGGHVLATMNDHVNAVADYLYKAGY